MAFFRYSGRPKAIQVPVTAPKTFTPGNINKQKLHNLFVNENIWKAVIKMAIPGMIIALMAGLYLFIDQILIIKLIPYDGVHGISSPGMLSWKEKFDPGIKALNDLLATHPNNASEINGLISSLDIGSVVRRAIAYSGAVTGMFNAVTLLFSIGTATRYSFYLGKGQIEKARETFNVGVIVTIFATVAISGVIFGVQNEWIRFQIEDTSSVPAWFPAAGTADYNAITTATKAASDLSVQWSSDFVSTLVWFVVTQGLFATIQYNLRSEGRTVIPLLIAIGTNCINVLLEYIFLAVLKLGIAGGAWATVIGWGLSLFAISGYLWYLLAKKQTLIRLGNPLKFSFASFTKANVRFVFAIILSIVTVGLASFVRNAAASFNGTLQNNAFAYVAGQEVGAYLSAFGSILPLWLLLFPVFLGIVQGASIITAYNYGASNYQRVKQSYWITVVMGVTYGVFIYLIVVLGLMRYVIEAFDLHEGSTQFDLTLRMANIWMANAIFWGFTLGAILLYQSTNRPLMSLITSAMPGLLAYVPIMYIFRETSNHDPFVFIWTTPTVLATSAIITTVCSVITMKYSLGKSKKDIMFREEKTYVPGYSLFFKRLKGLIHKETKQ